MNRQVRNLDVRSTALEVDWSLGVVGKVGNGAVAHHCPSSLTRVYARQAFLSSCPPCPPAGCPARCSPRVNGSGDQARRAECAESRPAGGEPSGLGGRQNLAALVARPAPQHERTPQGRPPRFDGGWRVRASGPQGSPSQGEPGRVGSRSGAGALEPRTPARCPRPSDRTGSDPDRRGGQAGRQIRATSQEPGRLGRSAGGEPSDPDGCSEDRRRAGTTTASSHRSGAGSDLARRPAPGPGAGRLRSRRAVGRRLRRDPRLIHPITPTSTTKGH